MATIWSLNRFNEPEDVRTFAECVTTSGGKVVAIVCAHTMPEFQWCVFATFEEAFQQSAALLAFDPFRTGLIYDR